MRLRWPCVLIQKVLTASVRTFSGMNVGGRSVLSCVCVLWSVSRTKSRGSSCILGLKKQENEPSFIQFIRITKKKEVFGYDILGELHRGYPALGFAGSNLLLKGASLFL